MPTEVTVTLLSCRILVELRKAAVAPLFVTDECFASPGPSSYSLRRFFTLVRSSRLSIGLIT
jgi:hypothetical protein